MTLPLWLAVVLILLAAIGALLVLFLIFIGVGSFFWGGCEFLD